jgi:hypothetical protein
MIVEGLELTGGQHCETTTLDVLLRHVGVELSEPMLFGLGEALGFIYWDSKAMGFPFLGGRTKPMTLTMTATRHLGVTPQVVETTSARKAWLHAKDQLDAGRPVGLQLDSYHLDHFTTKVHFGGHVVALYGYDDRDAYLVDTAQQGGAVRTSLDSLARARAERGPMTAKHLAYTLTEPAEGAVSPAAVIEAMTSNARDFLDPPISNLGHRGIAKAAKQVLRWFDRSTDPSDDLARTALLMEHGGTGGALFRNLYRDFLAECLDLVDDDRLRLGHRLYGEAAEQWTEVADRIGAAGATGSLAHLDEASSLLLDIADRERAAMEALAGLKG